MNFLNITNVGGYLEHEPDLICNQGTHQELKVIHTVY